MKRKQFTNFYLRHKRKQFTNFYLRHQRKIQFVLYFPIVIVAGASSAFFAILSIVRGNLNCPNNSLLNANDQTNIIKSGFVAGTKRYDISHLILIKILNPIALIIQVLSIWFRFKSIINSINKIIKERNVLVRKVTKQTDIPVIEKRLFDDGNIQKNLFFQLVNKLQDEQSHSLLALNSTAQSLQNNHAKLNDTSKSSIEEESFNNNKKNIIKMMQECLSNLEHKCQIKQVNDAQIDLSIKFCQSLLDTINSIQFTDLKKFNFTLYEEDILNYRKWATIKRLQVTRKQCIAAIPLRILDVADSLLGPIFVILNNSKEFKSYMPKFLQSNFDVIAMLSMRAMGHISRLYFERYLRSANHFEIIFKSQQLLDEKVMLDTLVRDINQVQFNNFTIFKTSKELKKTNEKELELVGIKIQSPSIIPQQFMFYTLSYISCFAWGMISLNLGIATILTIVFIVLSTSITGKYDTEIKNLNTSLEKEDTSKNNKWINRLNTLILTPELSSMYVLAKTLACKIPNLISNFSVSFNLDDILDKGLKILGVLRGFLGVVANLAIELTIARNPKNTIQECEEFLKKLDKDEDKSFGFDAKTLANNTLKMTKKPQGNRSLRKTFSTFFKPNNTIEKFEEFLNEFNIDNRRNLANSTLNMTNNLAETTISAGELLRLQEP